MSAIDDVSARILSLGLATAVGTDLFQSSAAEVPNPLTVGAAYIVLTETGGTAAVRRHDGRYPRPSVQVIVKALSSSVAKGKAEALHAALGDKYNVTMGTEFYLKVEAVQEVMDLRKDNAGNQQFGFNLDFLKR
jgi:hypothetical protein